ncbi:MAG: arsenate reductase-like glutaredoxin family protein [Maribacter sp.]|jgi:arsenate reductase-like glutaredoxin family protein
MDITIDIPFRLNFNNLDQETQEKLMQQSKQEVERKFSEDLKTYAVENYLDYDSLLEEEAIKNLYNHTFKFTI